MYRVYALKKACAYKQVFTVNFIRKFGTFKFDRNCHYANNKIGAEKKFRRSSTRANDKTTATEKRRDGTSKVFKASQKVSIFINFK